MKLTKSKLLMHEMTYGSSIGFSSSSSSRSRLWNCQRNHAVKPAFYVHIGLVQIKLCCTYMIMMGWGLRERCWCVKGACVQLRFCYIHTTIIVTGTYWLGVFYHYVMGRVCTSSLWHCIWLGRVVSLSHVRIRWSSQIVPWSVITRPCKFHRSV